MERGVGGQGLEQRQIAAQAVEDAHRRLGIGHADVHVQAAHRRDHRVAEQEADALVTVLVGDRRLALTGGRMGPGPEQARPGGQHGAAHLGQLGGGRPDAVVDARDQLNLAGVELALDRPRHLVEAVEDRAGGVDLAAVDGVDEEQLLLDPDGERVAGPEPVLLAARHWRPVWRAGSVSP
jgi:hypothetical protein